MAPQTDRPRLARLDPSAVADETITAILDHLQSYAIPLTTPGGDLRCVVAPTLVEARASTLHLEIRCATHWAQTGEWPLTGEADTPGLAHKLAWDALTEVVCRYWSSPSGDVLVPADADTDPETAIGCVVLACVARAAILGGEPVSRAQLAALGSCSIDRISQLVTAGDLATVDGRVTAASARRWLSGRGVPGL